MKNRFIYVVVSHTATRFGKLLRIFGKIEYNHSAIALDENFNELYAFARPQYRAMILARLVKESYTSYTLNTNQPIPIKVYKIPVSEQEHNYVRETILRIHNDERFHYNIFSVLTFPILNGCAVSKTYTCSEFVTHILKDIGFSMPLPCYQYKPEDLVHILKDYLFYEGDIRDVLSSQDIDKDFFAPLSLDIIVKSIKVLTTVAIRSIHFKKEHIPEIKIRQG